MRKWFTPYLDYVKESFLASRPSAYFNMVLIGAYGL